MTQNETQIHFVNVYAFPLKDSFKKFHWQLSQKWKKQSSHLYGTTKDPK